MKWKKKEKKEELQRSIRLTVGDKEMAVGSDPFKWITLGDWTVGAIWHTNTPAPKAELIRKHIGEGWVVSLGIATRLIRNSERFATGWDGNEEHMETITSLLPGDILEHAEPFDYRAKEGDAHPQIVVMSDVSLDILRPV
jgi:hypothetical protein